MAENEQKPAAPAAKSGSNPFAVVLILLAAAYGYLHFVAHAAVKIGHYIVH